MTAPSLDLPLHSFSKFFSPLFQNFLYFGIASIQDQIVMTVGPGGLAACTGTNSLSANQVGLWGAEEPKEPQRTATKSAALGYRSKSAWKQRTSFFFNFALCTCGHCSVSGLVPYVDM